MPLLNSPKFLKKVILTIAEDAYSEQVVECDMEDEVIGSGDNAEFATKREWVEDIVSQWIETAAIGYTESPEEALCKTKIEESDSEEVKMAKRFYELKLGEEFDLDNFVKIIRVPGGWLSRNSVNSVFIPYDLEFEELLEGDGNETEAISTTK